MDRNYGVRGVAIDSWSSRDGRELSFHARCLDIGYPAYKQGSKIDYIVMFAGDKPTGRDFPESTLVIPNVPTDFLDNVRDKIPGGDAVLALTYNRKKLVDMFCHVKVGGE